MAINLRSPYYTSITDASISYATLSISVWEGDVTGAVTPQYNLKKFKIGSSTTVLFEVSELIRDFIDVTFNGDYSGQAVWMETVIKAYNSSDVLINDDGETTLCVDGYSYFQEPTFNITDSSVMISNKTIFSLADNLFRIPIYTSLAPTVIFFKDNIALSTQSFSSSTLSSEQIKYVSLNGSAVNYDNYSERVIEDSGVLEGGSCLDSFLDDFQISEVDKIQITDNKGINIINIKTVDECKYDPKKVTFVNKFGVLQDMYFFKKSKEKLRVKKQSYKANIINSLGSYDTSNHSERSFNVTASESISLSSGYVNEEYNEVFKQLLLSEKVWMSEINELGEQITPINVETSSLDYKTSVNDKLVEYTINFNKSFNTINNVR